jgi:hypothetical protein
MSQERADKYRRKAEEYRLKAVKAPRDDDKVAWLKLAEDWQQLADTVPSPRPSEGSCNCPSGVAAAAIASTSMLRTTRTAKAARWARKRLAIRPG